MVSKLWWTQIQLIHPPYRHYLDSPHTRTKQHHRPFTSSWHSHKLRSLRKPSRRTFLTAIKDVWMDGWVEQEWIRVAFLHLIRSIMLVYVIRERTRYNARTERAMCWQFIASHIDRQRVLTRACMYTHLHTSISDAFPWFDFPIESILSNLLSLDWFQALNWVDPLTTIDVLLHLNRFSLPKSLSDLHASGHSTVNTSLGYYSRFPFFSELVPILIRVISQTSLSINQSVNQSVNQSINQSINQSVKSSQVCFVLLPRDLKVVK